MLRKIMSKSREQLNAWLKSLTIDGSCLLDVGVQDKPVTERLGECYVNCYKTLDVDPQWNPDFVFDLNEPLQNADALYGKTFSYIAAIEVLEHCWNPYQVLRNCYDLLKDGGMIIASFPFINPIHDYFDFARYTEQGITFLLEKVGFRDIDFSYRFATSGRQNLLDFYKAEGMRVSKIRPKKDHENKHIIGYMFKAKK